MPKVTIKPKPGKELPPDLELKLAAGLEKQGYKWTPEGWAKSGG